MRKLLLLAAILILPRITHAQCAVENLTDFESGTSGTAINATLLVSSTHGYTTVSSASFPFTGLWTVDDVGGALTFGTAANHPLLAPSGTLCGNNTNYPVGTGLLGMTGTGTGANARHYIIINLPTQLQTSTLVNSFWFCSDLAPSDNSNPDLADIHSTSDFAAINFLGNGTIRRFNLETGSTGLGGAFNINTGSCPANGVGGNWYHVFVILGHSGITPNSITAYDVNGNLAGSTSFNSINTGNATTAYIGAPGNPTSFITTGKHIFFDSWQLFNGCIGGSPTWTTTPDEASVQACINAASAGDTVNVLPGTATWGSTLTISGKKLTLTGASGSSGTGDPNVGGGVMTFTDNTNITLTSCGNISVTGSTTNFVQIQNFTFTETVVNCFGNPGVIKLVGAHGQQSFRFNNNHILGPTSGQTVGLNAQDGYGLIDHNYFQSQSAGNLIPLNTFGDTASFGYLNWQDTTALGTSNAIYIEQNYYVSLVNNNEGFIDCYFGAKNVIRFNTIVGTEVGGCHGTDTHSRSPVSWEEYGNHLTNNNGSVEAGHQRGGTSIIFREKFDGSAFWSKWNLAYFRINQQVAAELDDWGAAGPGLNWTPLGTTGNNSIINTLNAPAFISSHTYNAQDVFTSGGANFQVAASCTSGSAPSVPAEGSTTTTGTCTVQNVAGSTAASPAPGVAAGFDPANPDTPGTTSTFTRFFDTNGGVYPYRDQECLGHNQTNMPCYEWLNTGVAAPFFTNSQTTSSVFPSGVAQSARDYYDYTGSASVVAGVGVGTKAQRTGTCVTGVAYWATDEGSWNTSGNGAGNGNLYKCTGTNSWTLYYTPFTYPFSIPSGSGANAPTCNPPGGTYQIWTLVACLTTSQPTIMCYTTNGTTPVTNGTTGCTNGTKYATTPVGAPSPITVSLSGNLKIVAGGTGFLDSPVTSIPYTITGDKYGGRMDISCATITPTFHVEQIGSRWFFCTPQGHAFISYQLTSGTTPTLLDCNGVNQGSPNYTAKYGDQTFNWGAATTARASHWGFNTAGQDSVSFVQGIATCPSCSWPGHIQPFPMPYVIEAKPAENAAQNLSNIASGPIKDAVSATNSHWFPGFRGHAMFDVFDPGLAATWTAELASNVPAQIAIKNNDPYILYVVTDDSDFFVGAGSTPDFQTGNTNENAAFTALITSPVQAYTPQTNVGSKKLVYTNTLNFTKGQALNPVTPCSISAPCSLRDYLKQKYGTIAALNAAWGSNYTTFDSTATQVNTEAFATADGTTTTFTHTAAHGNIDPFSIQVFMNGVDQMGDCPWARIFTPNPCGLAGAPVNTGNLGSPVANLITQATSTVDYAGGNITINFVTAPAAGTAITFSYQYGGWMQGGTGLMDEDGTHTAWVGTNVYCLEGPNPSYFVYGACVSTSNPNCLTPGNCKGAPNDNPTLGADLDAWISQYAAQYFKTIHDLLRAEGSNVLYFGVDVTGSYGVSAPSQFDMGESPYVDGFFDGSFQIVQSVNITEYNARLQYHTQYIGNKPFTMFNVSGANQDSAYSCKPPGVINYPTQPARGQGWFNNIQALLNTPGANGTIQYVGTDWWVNQDIQNVNQGLTSLRDNAYDGVEVAVGNVQCDNYYTTLPGGLCGGELASANAPYGDAITLVTQANRLWLGTLSGSISISPPSMNFGTINVGSQGTPQTATVTNFTNASTNIVSTTIAPAAGTPAGDFIITANACTNGFTLTANGGQCTVTTNYLPTTTGPESATLAVTVTGGQQLPVSMTGGGGSTGAPAVTFSPTSAAFIPTGIGVANSVPITLTNSGTATLTITSITPGGTNAVDFRQTNNCPASLGVGLSCTIVVSFVPQGPIGTRNGSLIVSDNASGSPQSLALSGNAVPAPAPNPPFLSENTGAKHGH